MKIYPEFPLHRFKDPMRRAEKKLYDQLAQTDIQGYTLYEAYPSRMAPQLDFGIWLEEVARIALQCKGGIHRVHRGEWQLRTNQGWERKNRSPIMETRDSAMALREAMERGGGRGVFVIAALIFPNMEYDQFLADRAAEQKVHTLFGYEELVNRLVALADDQKILYPPTHRQILQEVESVMPELGHPAEPEQPRIVIQNVETLNFYVTPDDVQGGLLDLPRTE